MTDMPKNADALLPLDLPDAAAQQSPQPSAKKPKLARSQRLLTSSSETAHTLTKSVNRVEVFGSRHVVDVDPRTIVSDPVNVRGNVAFDPDAHSELISSMRVLGNTVPVVLRPSPEDGSAYRCVSGSRRVGAALHIGKDQSEFYIKAVVLDLTDEDALKIAEADNDGRTVASPIQTGRHWARQIEQLYGGSASAFAESLGKDKSVVSRTVALAGLPDWVLSRCSNVDALSVNFAAKLTPLLNDTLLNADIRRRADALVVADKRLPGPALLAALLAPDHKEGAVQEWASTNGASNAQLRRTKSGFRIDVTADQLASDDQRALIAAIRKFIA